MLPVPTSSQATQKGMFYHYENADFDTIVQGVDQFFRSRGYRLESGGPECGVYGIGSNALRVLFGAFVKRYAFRVTVQHATDGHQGVTFHLEKAMSGAMGGVIGHSKMTKEYNALTAAIAAGG